MPRKRKNEVPKFDPLKAWDEDCEQRQKRRQELDHEKERKAREEAELNQAWEQAITQFDLPSFQNLGEVLVRTNTAFWIDYLRVSLPRLLFVEALKGQDPQALRVDNKFPLQTLRLLIAACGESKLTLQAELERFPTIENALSARASVAKTLRHYRFEEIPLYNQNPHAAMTPWIRPAELAEAVQGEKGFSRTGIARLIESRELIVLDEHPLNRRSKLYRLRHRDPATHKVVLRSVIDFLKNRDKLVSANPWFAPLWEPL